MTARLAEHGDPERAIAQKAYLKSDLIHLGCTVPLIRREAKRAAREHALDVESTLDVAEALWQEPVHERRLGAVELIRTRVADLTFDHLPRLERLLRECRGWALLDPLALELGDLLEGPGGTPTLDRWAAGDDFWMRRTALLAHLGPLSAGRGDFERFARYADGMLDEREFFVRKAIGWVLRSAGKRDPERVAAWVLPRVERMSGVTYREAVKYLLPSDVERIAAARG
ncbi:MAG: DNA alkylation repair protein [Acidimicrobiia bacterium]|nr:DNA alkylation repair protein [Acidimicrobiia bacterium]